MIYPCRRFASYEWSIYSCQRKLYYSKSPRSVIMDGQVVTDVPVGENRQSCHEMHMGAREMSQERVSASSEAHIPAGGSDGSQLDHIFDLLELQEAAAERETEGGRWSEIFSCQVDRSTT